MTTLELDIESQELHYFDTFLSKEIMGPPVDSLRAEGSYDQKTRTYHRTYRVTIIKDAKRIVFRIDLSATSEKIDPLNVSIESEPSKNKFSENDLEKRGAGDPASASIVSV